MLEDVALWYESFGEMLSGVFVDEVDTQVRYTA